MCSGDRLPAFAPPAVLLERQPAGRVGSEEGFSVSKHSAAMGKAQLRKAQVAKKAKKSKRSHSEAKNKKVVRDLDVDEFLSGNHLDVIGDAAATTNPTTTTEEEDEAADHQAELRALEKKDPEFYAFLKEEDEELLEFEGGGDEAQEVQAVTEVKSSVKKSVLKMERLESLLSSCRECGRTKAIRRLLRIGRWCVAGPDEEVDTEILDVEVRHRGIAVVLQELGRLVSKEDEAARRASMKLAAKSLRSHTASSGASGMQCIAARKLAHLVPLITEQWAPRLVRVLVDNWAVALEEKEAEDETLADSRRLQVDCFLRLRELLPSCEEYCLRKTYSAFVRRVANSSANPLKAAKRAASVSFAAACVSDLYQRAPSHSYRLAFGYVRQLALKVRSALADPSKREEIMCWRFIHAVRLWSSACAAEGDSLGPLLFPLCQICFAACECVASPDLAPYKLHLVKCLHALAAAAQVYVPTTRILVQMLQHLASNDHTKKRKKDKTSVEVAHQLAFSLSGGMTDAALKDELSKEVCDLLCDWLELIRYSPACPEVSLVPSLALKKVIKDLPKTSIVRAAATSALAAFDKAAAWAAKARQDLQKSPKEIAACFEPLKPDHVPDAKARLAKRRTDRDRRRAKLAAAIAVPLTTAHKNTTPKDLESGGRDPSPDRFDHEHDDANSDLVTELNIDDF